jgi:hypothetical protein
MINNSDLKKSYKVILNGYDTNSYIGSNPYNTIYAVDLKTIIRNPEDYKKAYKLTYTFQSAEDDKIFMDEVYGIHIDCKKQINVMNSNRNAIGERLLSGMLNFYVPVGRTLGRFETNATDNDGVYYSNIENITAIQIRVLRTAQTMATTNQVHVPQANRYYICILCFTEV